MRRRMLLLALCGIGVAPGLGHAQGQSRVYRIGFLGAESEAQAKGQVAQLRTALGELGYVEGANLSILVRVANGDYARLPGLAAELAALKVDVVVASGSKAGIAAKGAAATTPVVVSNMGDAQQAGFSASLAHPGGNVTGISMLNPEVTAKQLELLREVKPRAARFAVLMNPANPNYDLTLEAARRQGSAMNVKVERFDARSGNEIEAAVRSIAAAKIDAMIVQSETLYVEHARLIADLAVKHRIAAAGTASFARAGGLIGYSADRSDLWRRMAGYVDRILKGAKAGELPIAQPTKFELVVNGTTAKALSLAIPRAMLDRADERI